MGKYVYFKDKALACAIDIKGKGDKAIWQDLINFQRSVEKYARSKRSNLNNAVKVKSNE